MKPFELNLVLTNEEHQALTRLAQEMALGDVSITAAFLLRDALIAQGFLTPDDLLDEDSETAGSA